MRRTHAPLVTLLLILSGAASAQQARIGGPVMPIEPDLIGYNIGTWFSGPGWDDPELRVALQRLAPGHLRYPGGTVANFWDWRTGTVIDDAQRGLYRHVADRDRLRPRDVVAGMPAGTAVHYVMNLARPTPVMGVDTATAEANPESLEILDAKVEDAIAAVRAFERAGHRVERITLGNEFYQGARGGRPGQGGIYTGNVDRYVRHAGRAARTLAGVFPGIAIGVIGEASDGDDPDPAWNRALRRALADGTLGEVDGISFHWYSGPGRLEGLAGADKAEASLGQAWFAAGALERDLSNLPDGVEAWSDEFNTFSDPDTGGPIQGTWLNGLFSALLTVRYATLDERIAMLTLHNIAYGKNLQWNMLFDEGLMSGNGVAVSAVSRAFRGRTELRRLVLDGVPAARGRRAPSVVGVRLSGRGGEAVVLFNTTRNAVNGLDVSATLQRDGRHQVEQHHDATPTTRARDGGAVRAGRDGGLSSRWWDLDGDRIDLPPFSITTIR